MVFGDDFETRDGTGERDYIHVVDVARAHLAAIEYAQSTPGFQVFNIGTGGGVCQNKRPAHCDDRHSTPARRSATVL